MTERTAEQAVDDIVARVEQEWTKAQETYERARQSCASQLAFQAIFAFRQGRRDLCDQLAGRAAELGYLLVYRPNSAVPWILVPEHTGPAPMLARVLGRRLWDYDNAAKLAPGGGDDPSKEWEPKL